MPNLSNFETREEFNKWYRDYRAKNRDKLRTYNREWMRKWREEKRKEKAPKEKFTLKGLLKMWRMK